MAVTKLLNIKERGGKKAKSEGLSNAIEYVMNPEKTRNGYLTGSNCGADAKNVFEAMMDTKGYYGKYGGRQGYHFIISFPEEDKVSPEVMLDVMAEFAERYLGDDFDYVYSVHDDKGHMHGHLIFNSVNRNTGYKYRYEKGDWEKYIQPVTDRICEEKGLRQLITMKYNKDEENGKINWYMKIRYDINECINHSESYEDFISYMQEFYGYTLREGVSKKYGHYIAFRPMEKPKAVRSYRLGKGYSASDIERRIKNNMRRKQGKIFVPPQIQKADFRNKGGIGYMKSSYLRWENMSIYQRQYLIKIINAKKMYGRLGSAGWENERNVAAINSIMKNLSFVRMQGITDKTELQKFIIKLEYENVSVEIKINNLREKYSDYLRGRRGQRSDFNLYKEYVVLYERLHGEKKPEKNTEDIIKKRMEQIEDTIDVEDVAEAYREYQEKMEECIFTLRNNRLKIRKAEKAMKTFQKVQKENEKDQEKQETKKERATEKESKREENK